MVTMFTSPLAVIRSESSTLDDRRQAVERHWRAVEREMMEAKRRIDENDYREPRLLQTVR